ncbi:hypothetical protein HDU87_001114 [Geranomyces variabilis]|uniref:UDP-galactose transporter n=1 Tax=Geranomyces variabilis TaxID=109894 RepID=A0AAD5XU30_9FUNG|nr:hypothetical protein HDU87_001114 [Geranomyces variabilis]
MRSPPPPVTTAPATLFGFPLKWLSLVTLVVQNSALALVMSYSRRTRTASTTTATEDDSSDPFPSSSDAPSSSPHPPQQYLVSTAVVMSELIKLLVCTVVYIRQEYSFGKTSAGGGGGRPHQRSFSLAALLRDLFGPDSSCAKMSVPAVLYFVQNNLQYLAVQHLDPATFQVTYQMKILTTALFSVLMLGRSLSRSKWMALVLLTFGIAIVQMDGKQKPSSSSSSSSSAAHTQTAAQPLIGLVAVTIACILSGLAGVWFEKVLKGSQASLFLRNMQLCLFSLIPGLFFGVFLMDGAAVRQHGFFQGYDAWTWAAILCQAIGGLIVALVVKYADNILKGFATSLSIILSSVASFFIFDFKLTLMFTIGSSVVLYATHLYGLPDKVGIAKRAASYSMSRPDSLPMLGGVDGSDGGGVGVGRDSSHDLLPRYQPSPVPRGA